MRSRTRGANIDHLAVGPGGVTVIDTKTDHGKLQVDRVGGLFGPRRSCLLIGGRDQTRLIDGVENQIGRVRAALARPGIDTVEIRGALGFAEPDGVPVFGQLSVRGIVIDGPKPVARLARRPGEVSPEAIQSLWRPPRPRVPASLSCPPATA